MMGDLVTPDGPGRPQVDKIGDRRRWLDHLADCTLCPVDLCDKGVELAAAVRAGLSPGESWEWA